MTPEKYRKIRSLIKQIDKCAVRADELELKLGNGGEIGSMLGGITSDLEAQLTKVVANDPEMRTYL